MEMPTPYGWFPVLWTELAPATVLKMGQYFALRENEPEKAADRHWLNGVFAFELGMPREGRTLIVDAAQSKDEYKDQLALFIEEAR